MSVSQKRSELELEGMKIESRLARALQRAIRKIQSSVSIYELGSAIQAKDINRAMALIPPDMIMDALTPCARIIEDAIVKGARIGASKVNG